MTTATKPAVSAPTEPAEILKILKRAESGDASALPVLRKMLDNSAIVEMCGNLAEQAELSLINAAAGNNLAFKEGLKRKLELMRAELAGPNPTPVERLLAERIVACWLQVQDADIRYAQGQKDCTFEQGDYRQRRMDRAHKRYLTAIKTLATVRKLAVPVLQVNIAKKQVNVAVLAFPTKGKTLDRAMKAKGQRKLLARRGTRREQQETAGQQGEAEQEVSNKEASWCSVMRRALGALGILVIWWRRISPEVSENKEDNIM